MDADQALASAVAGLEARLRELERRDPTAQQIPKDVASSTVRQLYQHGAANVSFVSGGGTLTIPTPFPTAMDGAIVLMSANSVGPASLAVSAVAPTSSSTVLCNLNQVSTSGPYQCWYWVWGH